MQEKIEIKGHHIDTATLLDSYSEKFNYASMECGAKILATNDESQVSLFPDVYDAHIWY